MNKPFTFWLSWLGLLGVIASQLWYVLVSDSISISAYLILVLAVLPIKGLLNERRYTFQWSGFLALIFFLLGVSDFFITMQWLSSAFLLLISSTAFYFGTVFHAKRLAHTNP